MATPFAQCADQTLAQVTDFLFDIDDTVTLDGALPREAANALYDAAESGLRLYAVTGRSASWAELLLRLFPLAGAVGETGAMGFVASAEGVPVHVFHAEDNAEKRRENQRVRKALEVKICAEIAGARMALDNMGRVYDSAFDLNEDGPEVPESVAAQIRDRLAAAGLTVAQSSVHINAWFGVFDKATMSERVLKHVRGAGFNDNATLLYAGDSKNDAAMFKRVTNSVGVRNVEKVLPELEKMNAAPAFITRGQGGLGFAEIVARLVAAR